MQQSQYQRCASVARGIEKADLVLKNANVVNVFSEQIIQADIAICAGIIAGVGHYQGHQEIDVQGKYVCPAFIDSHLHLESTLVTPTQLIHQAALRGTTTFIVDPHEATNVAGRDGVHFMLEQTENVPANVYVMLPSCVPSTSIDDNGAIFTAEDMKEFLDHPRVLGLGEVMDCPAVLNMDDQMQQKLSLFQHRPIDGHAPFLDDYSLAAYVLAGIDTDHECIDFEYAMKQVQQGMYVLIREGSAARNLEAIVSGIVATHTDTSRFCFCTDDKHIEDIQNEGHISHNVRKAIQFGIDPIKAIKMATINPATCYHLKHLGAIAPGYQADLIVFDDLNQIKINQVYHQGHLVDEAASFEQVPIHPALKHTMHLSPFTKDQLRLKIKHQPAYVIQMVPGQITTRAMQEEVPGDTLFTANATFNKIAAIERHRNTGKVGVAIIKGFGIAGGAIASSVSHDSHNIIVVGDNDDDMTLAVNELIRTQGGYTIAQQGHVVVTLPLPIMGLMSDASFTEVNLTLSLLNQKAHEMGVSAQIDPFSTLSFMALPVIDELRITPRGLYHVSENKFID